MSNETGWYWLSFIDRDKNEFLGVTIVYAYTLHDALKVATVFKLNPGGEVSVAAIPKKEQDIIFIRDAYRILSHEEATRLVIILDNS